MSGQERQGNELRHLRERKAVTEAKGQGVHETHGGLRKGLEGGEEKGSRRNVRRRKRKAAVCRIMGDFFL